MTTSIRITVHYPAAGRPLVLRTDQDWHRDLEPVEVTGTRHVFELPFTGPFHYLKPVLIEGGELRWSQGENYLVLTSNGPTRDLYPFFFVDPTCSPCMEHVLFDEAHGRQHRVRVFYPPGYAENGLQRYPTLYMQDGQNLFFREEAFAGQEWEIDETLAILNAMNLIRRVIVVGLYPQERERDYTQPGYEAYGRFVTGTVKPWVDRHYRTLDGPQHTAVMGSSLGAVASFYMAWQAPEVFGLVGCLSGTFGYRDDLFERVSAEPKRPLKVYLDSGWPRDNYEVTRRLHHLLLDRGYQTGAELLYLAFPRAEHNERAWAQRAHIPLQHFFGQR